MEKTASFRTRIDQADLIEIRGLLIDMGADFALHGCICKPNGTPIRRSTYRQYTAAYSKWTKAKGLGRHACK